MFISHHPAPDYILEREERRRSVRREVGALPITEAYVVRHLYGIGCDARPRTEVATSLMLTDEAVSVIEVTAIERLRDALRHLAFAAA